jgi:hypothetical protein
LTHFNKHLSFLLFFIIIFIVYDFSFDIHTNLWEGWKGDYIVADNAGGLNLY